MKRIARVLSLLLMISMAWTPMSVQAMMIGTDQVVAGAEARDARDKVVGFMARADVAGALERYGVPAASAQERVAAMTAEEIGELAGHIDSLPAGAATEFTLSASTWLIVAIFALIVFLVWYRGSART